MVNPLNGMTMAKKNPKAPGLTGGMVAGHSGKHQAPSVSRWFIRMGNSLTEPAKHIDINNYNSFS
jgi:hypothetical protein